MFRMARLPGFTITLYANTVFNRSPRIAIVPKFLSLSVNGKVQCVDSVVEAYRAAVKYALPSSAQILSPDGGDGCLAVSNWSQRNLEGEKMSKFQLTHVLDASLHKTAELFPVDLVSEVISAVSPSSRQRAVLREVPGNAGAKKQFLEVWRQGLLWLNLDLSALDVHGDVYADGDFGSLEWSPCEEKLVYVAEEKVAKSEPFYKAKAQKKEADSKIVKGEEHLHRQDWGEQLVGKHRPVVVVCDTSNPTSPLTVLEGLPTQLCPGQVCWAPGGGGVVGVAWDTVPRRLGLIYCTNRHSVLFHLALDGVFTALTGDALAVRSPRFSPDGQTLVWLQRAAGGPHHGALSLQRTAWSTPDQVQAETVVALERQHSLTVNGKQFYGLYNQQLTRRCWAEDSCRIVLSTPQKYSVNLYVVDTGNKSVTELELAEADLTVLDVVGDVVMCARSSFKSPPSLVVGRLPPPGQETEVQWVALTSATAPPGVEQLVCHYLDLRQDDAAGCCNSFNAIYFGPGGSEGQVPLVVWPHGGPHSSFSSNYKMEATFLAALGFGMLFVNFRGSIGMGQDCVEFLPGNIGSTDVKDVHLAAKEALARLPQLDPSKVVLMGGSHGGFLVAHLSGQFPLFYKAVVARNPVIDVGSMFLISDIPDWCVVEAGFEYCPATDITAEVYQKMKAASPIVHVPSVVAPTLLLLGRKDVRVPCSQGLCYYHLLRANNVPARVLLYDDCHPLGQTPVEMDNIINAALWFKEHLGITSS